MEETEGRLRWGRDQLIVLACLAAAAMLSWVYIAWLAARPMAGMADMNGMEGMGAAMAPPPSGASPFALTALMWLVMMTGMMLPSAAPMMMLYAQVQRRRSGTGPLVRTGLFVGAYLVVWTGFSLLAAFLQQMLAQRAFVTPALALASTRVAAAAMIAAGIYELTPIKQSCLAHCRGPVAFIAGHWRPGAAGAVRMGAEHGLFCLGCCWALMLLLFVGGVMNLLWVAGLAALVLVQKLLPLGRYASWVTAAALLVAGLVILVLARAPAVQGIPGM